MKILKNLITTNKSLIKNLYTYPKNNNININLISVCFSSQKHKAHINNNQSTKSIEQQSYFDQRIQKLDKNHKYPQFYPTISINDFIQKYSSKQIRQLFKISDDKKKNSQEFILPQFKQKISGRVTSIRTHGKTSFIDIRSQHHKLQLAWKKQKDDSSQSHLQDINRGDILGVQGTVFYTKTGQLSLKIQSVQILSPCYWMLPQYQSLKDQQARYRQRHLDFITNSQPFKKIKMRSKIMHSIRNYLQQKEFLQVQTPVLSQSAGGAIAKPFKTFHNDYKMNMYMRIAPQLYLKKLLIGGFTKVYQIGKNFRNQSVDQTHNPQFTSCQLYEAYSNYQKMITFTKDFICTVTLKVRQSYKVKNSQDKQIDLSKQNWIEVDFIEKLEQILKVKFPIQFDSQQSYQFLDYICKKNHVDCDQPRTAARLLDKIGQKYLQPINYPNPLIIKNHPKILSPLAKPIQQKPHLTQRFELFINGWQIVNSYTQLNDPFIQKQNTPHQTQYIQALQYGLMPCAGWGIGIDRLIMLLTQSDRIQEVITFPLLRKKQK